MILSKQRKSTQIKHKQIYDRYKSMVDEVKEKCNVSAQSLYLSHFYYRLSDEFGYDVKYIATIIGQQKKLEDARGN